MNNIKNEGYYNNFIVNDDLYRPKKVIYCGLNLSGLICPICKLILFNKKSLNSHNLCNEAYIRDFYNDKICPICKNTFKNKTNAEINKIIFEIFYKFILYKTGCKNIINYLKYFQCVNESEFQNNLYECQIEKYNAKNKNFENCCFTGSIKDIEKHFILCAFSKFKCLFCEEEVLQINLREHIQNKCKIGIIVYENGEKYIGEKKNNIKQGYGKFFYSDGSIYEGEWKDDVKEGFGTYYYVGGSLYEGEWKNNLQNGFCTYYYSNGDKYEGECKNGKIDGYGIYSYSNGKKYEGQFKNDKIEGLGIFNYRNGDIYEGNLKNNLKEGLGTYYFFSSKWKYEGEWRNDLRDGIGIQFFSNWLKYKGIWVNGKIKNFNTLIHCIYSLIGFLNKNVYIFIIFIILAVYINNSYY